MSVELFSRPVAGAATLHLGEVVSVEDPDSLSRVQVRLYAWDGIGDQDAAVWARVAVPFAGPSRGAFLLPNVGDEVAVAWVNGDSRFPVVVGGIWNGAQPAPETLPGNRVDRWTLTGTAGTRIAIEEEEGGSPTISLTTPGGVKATFTDEGGGEAKIEAGGASITLSSSGVEVQTGSNVKVSASQIEATAGMVKVDAGMSKFSGIVQCDTLVATTVVGTTYTPGAGNLW